VLVIEWKPDGARVRVDGQLLDRTTPTEVEVASGVEHTIDIDKDGYAPVRIRESLAAGERKRSHGELVATRASLSVITQPAGAQVKLGGRLLGTTPLERHDLDPGGAELTLTLDGYQPLRVPVNLVAGATAKVNKPLKEAVREGTVRIQLPMGNWAYAYLGERQLGSVRAPITLPVGHYKLRLYNPQTGKERFIEVDVFEGREKAYSIPDW